MMVLPHGIVEGDLRVTDGLIKTIAPQGGLQPRVGELVIDGTGLHLLPGAIDPHVHFRDPGHPEKEDLESGSRAAAAGGITSFLDMPNTLPNATNRTALEAKIASASKKAVTHHGFFIGATTNNVPDLQSVEGMDGVCGIKIFMGSSTGDLLVHEQKHLRTFLQIREALLQLMQKMRIDCNREFQSLNIVQILLRMQNIEISSVHF